MFRGKAHSPVDLKRLAGGAVGGAIGEQLREGNCGRAVRLRSGEGPCRRVHDGARQLDGHDGIGEAMLNRLE